MSGRPDDGRLLALGEEVHRLLQELARRLGARRPVSRHAASRLAGVDMRLDLGGGVEAQRRFAKTLVERMERVLDDTIEQATALRPGRTYCHRCSGATCEHALPPSPRHVFAAYSLNGTPHWIDFAQLCLERKHPAVDRLYGTPPAFVSFVQGGAELHGDMLQVLRKSRYQLVGQVCAGFYPLRARAEEGRGVLAITVQVSELRRRHQRRRYAINVVGCAPGGESLDLLWDREVDLPWMRAVRWGRSALETLRIRRPSGRAGAGNREQRALGILQGIGRRLEQDRRAHARRTRHASERHASGKRPTRNAVEDARGAAVDNCMMDDRSGTLVVLGQRGRTHFFTPTGKLVSSVRYSREAVERKIKQELWRPATEEEWNQLREGLDEEPQTKQR